MYNTQTKDRNARKYILLRQISKHFPELLWKRAHYISHGFDHDVIILDQNLVFRLPKNAYSKKILVDEIGLLELLRKRISVAVPYYQFIVKGSLFAGYSMIQGKSLTTRLYNKLSSSQKNDLACKLGQFLSELHSMPIANIKDFHIRVRSTKNELKLLVEDAKCYLYPSFSENELQVFYRFFSELVEIFREDQSKVLIHGDFSEDHFIINEQDCLEGIIDFTDKAIHDPAFDFIFLWGFGLSFVTAVYDNYTIPNKDGILTRSNAFGKASAIWNMIQAKKTGQEKNYRSWYRRFKLLDKSASLSVMK